MNLRSRWTAWLAAGCLCHPVLAQAHAFGERYDLPVPLGYFVVGAALTVALSLVVAAVFVREASRGEAEGARTVSLGPLLPLLHATGRVLGIVLLCAVVVAGLYGTRNPEMNLAPVLVWIIWWVGLSYAVACFGNFWPALDPWRTLFDGLDALARRRGRAAGIALGMAWPARLGAWPAVFLLLLFVWLEVIYPRSALPSQLAWLALAWSALTLAGMVCFGRETWQRNADVFSIYFSTLGRFAPVVAGSDGRSITLRLPGRGLIVAGLDTAAMAAFVIAMLTTVLFDGLLTTQGMVMVRHAVVAWFPVLANDQGYVLGTAGLVGVWLLFGGAFLLACAVTARLVPSQPTLAVASRFAATLVPIAIAYNVAHYFSYLVVHGQLLIPLLSDPLGLGWNLFGTARYFPDIAVIDARTTWQLAIGAIVAGHVISIWLAHRLALRVFGMPRRAVLATIPLTVLMVAYTAVSLLILAEPLVQFAGSVPR